VELPDEPAEGADCRDIGRPPVQEDELDWLSQPASDLVDHRRRGQFKSRYPKSALWQIALEFAYLFLLLSLAVAGLLFIGYVAGASTPEDSRSFGIISYPRDRSLLLVLTVALSGIVGGSAFALKWLYHSVAKWTWNCDRLWWRLIVPVLSGVLALFVSALVTTGTVAVFNPNFFKSFYGALGGGFFIGYFSDNVLAALQNLAVKWFGTVDKRYHGRAAGGQHVDGTKNEEEVDGGAGAPPQANGDAPSGVSP
jgi:hypothetical protein